MYRSFAVFLRNNRYIFQGLFNSNITIYTHHADSPRFYFLYKVLYKMWDLFEDWARDAKTVKKVPIRPCSKVIATFVLQ